MDHPSDIVETGDSGFNWNEIKGFSSSVRPLKIHLIVFFERFDFSKIASILPTFSFSLMETYGSLAYLKSNQIR